jgi:hypothetical protein
MCARYRTVRGSPHIAIKPCHSWRILYTAGRPQTIHSTINLQNTQENYSALNVSPHRHLSEEKGDMEVFIAVIFNHWIINGPTTQSLVISLLMSL